mgnify:CR=1 FL=1
MYFGTHQKKWRYSWSVKLLIPLNCLTGLPVAPDILGLIHRPSLPILWFVAGNSFKMAGGDVLTWRRKILKLLEIRNRAEWICFTDIIKAREYSSHESWNLCMFGILDRVCHGIVYIPSIFKLVKIESFLNVSVTGIKHPHTFRKNWLINRLAD